MGKTISKFTVPKIHRNGAALAAKMRGSAKFHDRRAPRGGARNEQADLLDEMLDEDWYDEVG